MMLRPEPPVKGHVTLRLDPDQLEELREVASANERSISAELRIAVRKHLETERAAA